MSIDADQYSESSRQARRTGRRRFALAACISLALHGGLLAVQPGGWDAADARQALSPGGRLTGDAAPLVVRLAPYRLQPPQALPPPRPERTPTAPAPRQLAPSVADSGESDGGAAKSPATATAASAPLPPGLPTPKYFDVDEVSSHAEVLQEVDFDLPDLQTLPGAGKTILTLYINEAGNVDRVEIESSSIGEQLTNAVAQPFGRAVFSPAQIEGAAVKSRMRIEILVRPLLQR